jgi:hypothetical protein
MFGGVHDVEPTEHDSSALVVCHGSANTGRIGRISGLLSSLPSNPANTPNPPRVGTTMAYHKGRGIMFGGVHDVELSEAGFFRRSHRTVGAVDDGASAVGGVTLKNQVSW